MEIAATSPIGDTRLLFQHCGVNERFLDDQTFAAVALGDLGWPF
jgi:hypothetical protein